MHAGVLGRNVPVTARRLVAFIFHPTDPFAISVQRTNSDYVVNFHLRHVSGDWCNFWKEILVNTCMLEMHLHEMFFDTKTLPTNHLKVRRMCVNWTDIKILINASGSSWRILELWIKKKDIIRSCLVRINYISTHLFLCL